MYVFYLDFLKTRILAIFSKELLYLFTVVLFYFKNEVDVFDLKQTITECDSSQNIVDMLLQARYRLQNILVNLYEEGSS